MILRMMSLLRWRVGTSKRRPLSCPLSAKTITRSMSVPPVRCARPLLALMPVPDDGHKDVEIDDTASRMHAELSCCWLHSQDYSLWRGVAH